MEWSVAAVCIVALVGGVTMLVSLEVLASSRAMTVLLRGVLGSMSVMIEIQRNGGTNVPVGSMKAGGVAKGDVYPLDALPRWSQLLGRLPDGNPDPAASSDCGETCVASVVAAVHGVPVSAGDVREYLGGWNRVGITDGHALSLALEAYHVASESVELPWVMAWQLLRNQWAAARPAIVLGSWLVGPVLHWMLLEGRGNELLVFIDPWTGGLHEVSLAEFEANYRGCVVRVDAQLHYDMSAVPCPGTGSVLES